MIPYQTKVKRFQGTRYGEVREYASALMNQIEKRTKRRPYIRSAYFTKQKIFFDYFWPHLFQKNPRDRVRRLQYFGAALDLIRNSRNHPITEENRSKKGEAIHRFLGMTKGKEMFYVQIKEDKRSGRKYFMSCFPLE